MFDCVLKGSQIKINPHSVVRFQEQSGRFGVKIDCFNFEAYHREKGQPVEITGGVL